MTASEEQTVLAEERTVLSKERTDLSGGVLEHAVPTGIEVVPGTWMRKRGPAIWLGAPVLAVIGLFFAAGVIFAPMDASPGESIGTLVAVELMLIAIAALFITAAVRMARAGLRISAQGVSLRGVLRTWNLSLAEVEQFVPGTFSSGLVRSDIGVKLAQRQGNDLIVWAMRGSAPSSGDKLEAALTELQPLCDELNELLYSMRGERLDRSKLANEQLLTQADADSAYRAARLAMIRSTVGLVAVVAAMALLGSGPWRWHLGVLALWVCIGVPVSLLSHRRELDAKVRAGEKALGKNDVPPPPS
ncbi:MAG TPA: hypothetical protein VIE64_08070 [Solirubrobacterales bacterium]